MTKSKTGKFAGEYKITGKSKVTQKDIDLVKKAGGKGKK